MMKIGIQGGAGSYHEAVALQYYGPDAEIEYIDTFKHVFDAVQAGSVGSAVVAIANNRYGLIPESFNEMVARAGDLSVVGESFYRVQHQLLGIEGSSIEQITEVHSQAPALGQCHGFLTDHLPGAKLVEEADTALSAKLVAETGDPHLAAIASAQAGELYGLSVLKANIQDDHANYTRFLVVEDGGQARHVPGSNKTTMLLKTSQTPGSLARALDPFEAQGVNIETLLSSFMPNTGFDMQFWLEFDAGIDDPRTKAIFEELERQQAQTLILGSYASANQEMTND